jgi:hypothetical protein
MDACSTELELKNHNNNEMGLMVLVQFYELQSFPSILVV